MYSPDTIVAIATPAGTGGIAVVRISGTDALGVARRLFPALPERPSSHRFYAGWIRDASGDRIDRGLCVAMRAPRSYTGEDVVELHCHGGSLLARIVLASALAAGARAAEPGEFTLRAFLNGRLDLAQAESVADLIAARTPAAIRVASAHLGGELSRTVEAIREDLIGVAARLEVTLDFSEEDVGELDRDALATELQKLADRIEAIGATYRGGRILREGARVAIVGRPNVGKSSLLNRLLRSERAIVTPIPGTTRDVIEEVVDLGGVPVVLSDTAGVCESADPVERIGIERARAAIAEADLALVVLDGSRRLEMDDHTVLDATQYKLRIILINKADLERVSTLAELSIDSGVEPLEVSALTGLGLDALCVRIAEVLGRDALDAGAVVITRERHFQALRSAAESCRNGIASLRAGLPADIVSVDVAGALDHLGEIVGRSSPEAVLDRIFSEFCIGK